MTDAVSAISEVSTSAAQVAHDITLTGLIADADIVVKIVMTLLVVASLACWAIIFDKWLTFRSLKFKTKRFEKLFGSSASLGQIYDRVAKRPDNPMATLFVIAMRELNEGDHKQVRTPSAELKLSVKEKIIQALYATKNRALGRLEKDMVFLATVGSAAPFIGLFGTVWGIMNSFQSIAATKNTTLAVVAPGIAEALLATAIGLFAAIPAVIAYNILGSQIRAYASRIEDFLSQLTTIVAHELQFGSAK